MIVWSTARPHRLGVKSESEVADFTSDAPLK
jgi:hypothetical protein